MDNEEEAS